ncbi:MAG: 3-deoxy-manno-octulosonate cytidylyltransferase, partial [Porticoccaceae bacterium]|nr:3-deoxy-manno-octulosonate cytidylyltransferase [Porticoccaceae bacterium]
MAFVVIIPARYASSRLPGKPLKDIAGLPMIQRVWQQACKSSASRVVIATDDGRIKSVAEAFGAEVCMTREDHVSGTDRLQEVASQLNLAEDQVVVNVQGDEPLIPPTVIDQVANNLSMNEAAGVATLRKAITLNDDLQNPNIVKVVASLSGFASYFSRAPIPWVRDKGLSEGCTAHRHIGIYAYRVAYLNRFVQWPVAPDEQAESLEQLRFLWNDVSIHVDDAIAEVPGGIDTEEDLK